MTPTKYSGEERRQIRDVENKFNFGRGVIATILVFIGLFIAFLVYVASTANANKIEIVELKGRVKHNETSTQKIDDLHDNIHKLENIINTVSLKLDNIDKSLDEKTDSIKKQVYVLEKKMGLSE